MGRMIGLIFLYLVAGVFATPLACPFLGWGFWAIWLPLSIVGGIATALLSNVDTRESPALKWVVVAFYGFPVGVIFFALAGICVLYVVHISAPVVFIGAGGALVLFVREMGHGHGWSASRVTTELDAIADETHPRHAEVLARVLARGEARKHGGGHH